MKSSGPNKDRPEPSRTIGIITAQFAEEMISAKGEWVEMPAPRSNNINPLIHRAIGARISEVIYENETLYGRIRIIK